MLLDGLDEVSNEEERERVLLFIDRVRERWPAARLVITSRPFKTDEVRAKGLTATTIAAFDREQIGTFLGLWVRAFAPDEATYRKELDEAIVEREDIRALAQNPVMLTCLCVVHYNERRKLPKGRAAAYKAVLLWLLGAREKDRKAAGYAEDLAEDGFFALALSMTLHPDGKRAAMSIAEAARSELLLDLFADHSRLARERLPRLIEAWLRWECTGSGVIQEEGPDVKFWHLTFQEVLVADALTRRHTTKRGGGFWEVLKAQARRPAMARGPRPAVPREHLIH